MSASSVFTSVAGRYARLPRLVGRSFLPIAFFARLPVGMLTVGALTMVTAASQSYAIGGTAAGAVGIGSAVGAPAIGYLADRQGQRPVLIISALANAVAVIALVVTTYLAAGQMLPAAVVLAAAFAAGITCPQVGPLARVRWIALTAGQEGNSDRDAALSYESTADELTFVLGPALVGVLASLAAPWLPLALAAVLTVTLVVAFAVHPTHRAVVPMPRSLVEQQRSRKVVRAGARKAAGWGLIAVPVLGMILMGTFFGSMQAALTAFAGSFGAPESGGLLYAVIGLSSAVTALSVAYWPQTIGYSLRWVISAGFMVLLVPLVFLPGEVPPMVLVLLVLGLPVGPIMVTVFSIASQLSPKERLGTVMTLLASGVVVGVALGSAAAGTIAEAADHAAAFTVPAAAAVLLLAVGTTAHLALRRRRR